MGKYADYKNDLAEIAKGCLQDLGCQPVLFVGSGLATRYADGPSWRDLLDIVIDENPLIQEELPFLLQREGSLPKVGSALVDKYHEYAWTVGREQFPGDIFSDAISKDAYLKYGVASVVAGKVNLQSDKYQAEISGLRHIRPNSVITTNYDGMLEEIFPEYTPVVGQKIIRSANMMIGEIFKIHGCISDPNTLVLTEEDYVGWCDRKKYLSAKLLTLFLEHPVIILGYAAQDDNVVSILRDIDEILSSDGEIVSNIFYVVYDPTLTESSSPPRETVLDLGGGRTMRVNCIHANDFSWVYEAFAASEGVQNVNPRVLRALVARTYDLVRTDIPKLSMEVNFQTLESAAQNDGTLPTLLGITSLSDPQNFNAKYPYLTSSLGVKLGFPGWHGVRKLIDIVKKESGVDICASDNHYHIGVKSGMAKSGSPNLIHKYSEAAFDLLRKVRDGEFYELDMKSKPVAKKIANKKQLAVPPLLAPVN